MDTEVPPINLSLDGKRFAVDHAMPGMEGGFVHKRHDEVRDLFTSLLKDVCHNVEVEPHLRFRPSQEKF